MRMATTMRDTDEPKASAGSRLRVVIADDASAMRALLRRMLEDSPAFEIVGEAGDGEEAVRLARTFHPDLVLLDVAMPIMDGLEAIPRIRRSSPESRIVVLSAMEAGQVRDRAMTSGADAFIEKRLLSDSLIQRLVEACRMPHDDRVAVPPGSVTSPPEGRPPAAGPDWFDVAFDHAPIGMAVLDLDGRIQNVNDAFCRMVVHPRTYLVGTGIDEISHPGDVDRHARLREGLLRPAPSTGPDASAGTSYDGENRFIRADGHIVSTLVSCSVLPAGDGSPWRFVCQVVDITERRVAEVTSARAEELRERFEKELARSNADLALFATVAAHDLKSPLQVISGFGALLEQTHGEVLDDRGKEFLAFILKSATRMNVLIDDLLAYAKVGADRRSPVAVPLDRVVEEATAALEAEIAVSGGVVEADALPVVTGDPTQFVHLLQNLLANGLKFVADGVTPRIRVSASRMINAWCIEVADNGIGIAPQYRTHVFGMFQRLGRNEYEGTGIGLAICKRIVEQRGGSIWVEENPLGGSRFRFTVPDELVSLRLSGGADDLATGPGLAEAGPAAGGESSELALTAFLPVEAGEPELSLVADESSGERGGERGADSRVAADRLDVLLVEDDDDHARLVAETLLIAPEGSYRLRRARSLAGARIELQRGRTDCILLDLFLPDGQGLDSLSQLTVLEPLVPIVILTSVADEQLGLQAVHQGAQDYLVKGTVDGPRLSRSLRHAIERKALEARFAEQALHDPLTGLANRTLIIDRLRLELGRAGRTGTGVAVFYLDVDGFKGINDRWGHDAGDEVLVRVARRLTQMVRSGDTVGRIGGDEFVVVCGGIDTDDDRAQMRARIEEAVGRPLLLGGGTELVTASIGVTIARDASEEPAVIIRRADEAMYQAKRHRPPRPDR